MKKVIALLCLCVPAVVLTGCSTQSITDLEMAVDAAAAILPALPDVPPAVATYAQQAAQVITAVTTQLESGTVTAAEIAQITAEVSAIVKPDLPAGTAATVVTDVNALATALENFLQAIPQTAPVTASAVTARAVSPRNAWKLRDQDIARILVIHAKASALAAANWATR
jgi:hypothetical protein